MPKRDNRNLASRQLYVRRVPGAAARRDGKQVFYVRMKKRALTVGPSWNDAEDRVEPLAPSGRPASMPVSPSVITAEGKAGDTTPPPAGASPTPDAAPPSQPHDAQVIGHLPAEPAAGLPASGWSAREEKAAPPPTAASTEELPV